jgi:hypothetical protein
MEDTGKRPGGLTALAVINFILGGIFLLSILGVVLGKYGIEMNEKALDQRIQNDPNLVERDPQIAKQQEDLETAKKALSDPTLRMLTFLSIIPTSLMIVSGVGYLKQKKILGWMMGNLYAVISISLGIAEILMIDEEITGGFGIASLIGFIYPALTLFLMNVTFKEDFAE